MAWSGCPVPRAVPIHHGGLSARRGGVLQRQPEAACTRAAWAAPLSVRPCQQGLQEANHGDKARPRECSRGPRDGDRRGGVGERRRSRTAGRPGGQHSGRIGRISRIERSTGASETPTGRETTTTARSRSSQPAGPRSGGHPATADSIRQEAATCDRRVESTTGGRPGIEPQLIDRTQLPTSVRLQRGASLRTMTASATGRATASASNAQNETTLISTPAECATLATMNSTYRCRK